MKIFCEIRNENNELLDGIVQVGETVKQTDDKVAIFDIPNGKYFFRALSKQHRGLVEEIEVLEDNQKIILNVRSD